MTVTFNEDRQGRRLEELRGKEAEDLTALLATRHHLPYLDLSKFSINTDALRLIPESDARAASIAAFNITGKILSVAILTPQNPTTQKIIAELTDKGFAVTPYLSSEASLERAFARYSEISRSTRATAGVIDISSEEIENFLKEIADLEEVKRCFAKESDVALAEGSITDVLEIILAGGILVQASDIHLEPEADAVRLRYRLDGVLHDITFFNSKLYRQILSRVKLVSGLKLNVLKTAQDGRFSIKLSKQEIEVRTSVLPGAYGESTVLRILNPESILVELEALGIEPTLYQIINQEIAKPNGLILLTGPTGAGKTTTLYAILRRINSTETKIITIEDPIEYHLEGVNQTQVNTGKDYTFLTGLRSALRQDPDVIMVGEIRDAETAKIAVNASLTGHLVLSTLHTNNAAGTIPRLIDLEANPKVLDAALNITIAQRLVRKLCPACKRQVTLTKNDQQLVARVLAGIKRKRPALAPAEITAPIVLWEAVGCHQCHGTGYRGRIGVFEAILLDQNIAELLIKNPSEREIKRVAMTQEILDLREDGVTKALAGITSLGELNRVIDMNEEFL
ncbi:MAG TPA: GspE/PulE family protein [Candidatus Paceibacterota bacterium]